MVGVVCKPILVFSLGLAKLNKFVWLDKIWTQIDFWCNKNKNTLENGVRLWRWPNLLLLMKIYHPELFDIYLQELPQEIQKLCRSTLSVDLVSHQSSPSQTIFASIYIACTGWVIGSIGNRANSVRLALGPSLRKGWETSTTRSHEAACIPIILLNIYLPPQMTLSIQLYLTN